MDPTTETALAIAFIVGIILASECLVGILWATRAGLASDEEYRFKIVFTVALMSALLIIYLGIWSSDVSDAYLAWFRAFLSMYSKTS